MSTHKVRRKKNKGSIACRYNKEKVFESKFQKDKKKEKWFLLVTWSDVFIIPISFLFFPSFSLLFCYLQYILQCYVIFFSFQHHPYILFFLVNENVCKHGWLVEVYLSKRKTFIVKKRIEHHFYGEWRYLPTYQPIYMCVTNIE